jgi:acetyl esterase/lipase
VLIWVYGGGYSSGERQLPAPADLAYALIGSYFARRGFVVVIPDYRLVPNVRFPGQAEDIRDAIIWTTKHPEHLTAACSPNPDVQNIYLMGHSAGASNVFTAVVLPDNEDSDLSRRSIAGLIMCAGTHSFHDLSPEYSLWEVLADYWGGPEEIKANCSSGLLSSASDSVITSLPKLLVVEAEREPDWLLSAGKEFRGTLEARTGKKVEMIVAKGHNHVSYNLALGTGQGEQWAEEVVKWIGMSK